MTAEKKDRRPLRIKNLADLKRHIKLGTELVATAHQYHPDSLHQRKMKCHLHHATGYDREDRPDIHGRHRE